ncbi:hypothetical protein [Puia dinghuensis]|uniref:hypothetical protein n=1 Tax=Puia dinghuensis TaxID=1792502 RepID=UPI00166A8CB9|nr:hypothetical protein [Puia dinghuensis]
MNNWVGGLITLISGSAIWEGVKFFYPSISREIKTYREAYKNLYESIDPILKAADELYGKLISIANEDFSTFTNRGKSNATDVDLNRKYIYYLFAQFLAQLEYIRMKSQYSSISKIRKGRELLKFIETYESRTFRLVDRSIQRMIGESLILNSTGSYKVMSLSQFYINIHDASSKSNIWIKKIEDKLLATNDKEVRQSVLVFGVIVAALINHFDPKSRIVRSRKIYKNKLSRDSKNKISKVLFTSYLPFIKNKEIYY